jgi:primosomal protein N'
MTELQLDPEHKESKKLKEMMAAHARKLQRALEEAKDDKEKQAAVYAFYRKYYTLTLCKTCIAAGINKSPTRDIILDYPWKDLKLNRIVCLKIWEKINH